jgi:hypothetical protein
MKTVFCVSFIAAQHGGKERERKKEFSGQLEFVDKALQAVDTVVEYLCILNTYCVAII